MGWYSKDVYVRSSCLGKDISFFVIYYIVDLIMNKVMGIDVFKWSMIMILVEKLFFINIYIILL